MSRRVDADVVLAALRIIDDGLSARDVANGALRASNARHRVRSLVQQIENQAVTSESPVTELDGATEQPPEYAQIADAGQFAASWNARTPEQRQEWVKWMSVLAENVMRCAMQDHEGAVEMQRLAFVASVDLEHWARRMREFADAWDSRTDTSDQIVTYITMRGEPGARYEHEHTLTTRDLRQAAAIAQRIAHDGIDHAVMVGVHHWENATTSVDIVSIDGRTLIDYAAVDSWLTETGWTER